MEHAVLAVNNFIRDTTNFLNIFSSQCEDKLFNISCKLSELEILLNALQVKCDSLPNAISIHEESKETTEVREIVPSIEINPLEQQAEGIERVASDPVAADESPNLDYYFRLIRLGVPKEVVVLKMKDAGLDPQGLDII